MMGAALIALGIFLSSLTDNQGFAAGIGIAVILLNYYSVRLSEHVSSTAMGTVIAFGVLILALGAVIWYLTKNENLAYGCCFALAAVLILVNVLDNCLSGGRLFPRDPRHHAGSPDCGEYFRLRSAHIHDQV